MSKYTTELRFICETYAGETESQEYDSIEEIISKARPKLFDFTYPIFDEDYRSELEQKIIRHFYTREIGQETVGLFKLQLSAKMNEIMPYYNQLYKSTLLEIDPLTDMSYERSGSESLSTSESLATSETANDSGTIYNSLYPNSYEWNLEQDTPQNQLSEVANLEYLSRATKVQRGGDDQEYTRTSGNKSNSSNTNRTGLDSKGYLEKFTGYRNNNPSKLLKDYRETFLNIDLMIIGELEKLFFQLW